MGGLAWACGRLSGGGYDHGWAQMHVRINRPVSTRESAAIRVQLVTCLLPCGRGPAYCDHRVPDEGVPKMESWEGSSSCWQRHRKQGGAEAWSLKRVYRVLSSSDSLAWLAEWVWAGETGGGSGTGEAAGGSPARALPVSRVESNSSDGAAAKSIGFARRLRGAQVCGAALRGQSARPPPAPRAD